MDSKYDYKLTALAKTDIDSTLSYITENLANKTAAKNYLLI